VEPVVLGALEFGSLAVGMKALDEMVKIAPIRILEARTICPGKYLVIFSGDVASVEYSFKKGCETGKEQLVDSLFLPMAHPDVAPAIGKLVACSDWNSIGIIETLSVVSGIEAADAAAKAGNVKIIEIRLAIGFGGKSYVKMMGTLDAVEVSLEAGSSKARLKGMLCAATLLPHPHPEIKPHFL